jgi:hypothetical protein
MADMAGLLSVCLLFLTLDKHSRTDYNRRKIGVLFNGEQEDMYAYSCNWRAYGLRRRQAWS